MPSGNTLITPINRRRRLERQQALAVPQQAVTSDQQALPSSGAEDELTDEQKVERRNAADLEYLDRTSTDGRKHYVTKKGSIRKRNKPYKDQAYSGCHKTAVTEDEVFIVRAGYIHGTLAAFRNNPTKKRCRIWLTPLEYEGLTFLRIKNGERPPQSRGGIVARAENRIRAQENYKSLPLRNPANALYKQGI